MKTTRLVVVAVLALLVSIAMPAEAANVRQDLVAHWPFNEGIGTTVNDASGNGNDASIFGPSWTTDSAALFGPGANSRKNPFALQFDGIDDYAEVPHSPGLNPGAGLTVTAWVKVDPIQLAADGHWGIVDKSHGVTGANGWVLLGVPSGLPVLGGMNRSPNAGEVIFAFGTGSGFVHVGTVESILDNVFHFVAATWDGAVMKMYLDGALTETVPFAGPIANNADNVFIGRGVFGPRPFRGVIDEARVYGVGLNANQVRKLAKGGGPSP